MRILTHRSLTLLAWMLIWGLSSCFAPSERLELRKSGECPQTKVGQRVFVEGYFGIDPKRSVATEGGYEGVYPYSRFAFSAEPGSESMFEAAVVRANDGNNGPEKANRTEPAVSNDQPAWHIFDNQRREISFSDRVRITGIMIEDCKIKVDKIEKLPRI